MNSIKHLGKLLLRAEYRKRYFELRRLQKMPRYKQTSTTLLGSEIELVDAVSFLFMYAEIFEQQIYKFKAKNIEPIIIDCGANIGLSVIFFKQLYPNSHITAFEPDSQVYDILEKNIQKFNFSNVKLIKKALWSSTNTLDFMAEGADGGRIIYLQSNQDKYQVSTTRLRKYLNQPVDLLKIDIEGAETEVIKDCQDLLINVDNLFVEYHSFVKYPQTLHTLVNILHETGFRLHIHPPMTSPQPFYSRNVYLGMDMQLNIFAFRES